MSAETSKSSELVLFARVARQIGFSPATAEQLAEAGEFLPPLWLGSRRYLFRRDVDNSAQRSLTMATALLDPAVAVEAITSPIVTISLCVVCEERPRAGRAVRSHGVRFASARRPAGSPGAHRCRGGSCREEPEATAARPASTTK